MIIFKDHPEFTPDLTPRQIFEMGSFGGTYWRPIYSGVTNRYYKNQQKKYADLKGIPTEYLTKPWDQYDKNINKYKVKVGTTLEYWEDKEWIHCQDPYGWVQWYIEFYNGRRSPDDERQIKRWKAIDRFKTRLQNLIKEGKDSPAIKQTLQHWAISN